ncbi:hypothetical protein ACOMHN_014805 [Nucella lapillus]
MLMIIMCQSHQGHYVLDVKVLDSDTGHNPVTVHFPRKSFPSSRMVPGAILPVAMHRDRYTLALNLAVESNPPSVGPRCNCTASFHEPCNATTGQHYCAPGFTGPGCKTAISPCHVSTCLNGGTCEATANGVICHCAQGFSGTHCQTNLDDCAGVTCQNGGTCSDGVSGYVCECAPGFLGPHCESALHASRETSSLGEE